MVLQKRGRLFRRKDGKYLIYLPLDVATDSQFPFKFEGQDFSMPVLVAIHTKQKLLIISEV